LSFSRSHRQRSQNVVEFGLGIAAVAFVAMVGFNALGTAQAVYWGATASQFAPQPPAGSTPLHSTTLMVNAPTLHCDPTTTYHTNELLTCVATVKDMSGTSPTSPPGQVTWTLDGTPLPIPCPLTPVASTVTSRCTLNYTWASPGTPHTLVATYVPAGNFQSNTPVTLTFTVHPPYQFNFACMNPWTGEAFNMGVGQPLWCNLTVTDQSTGLAVPGVLVIVTSSASGLGEPYFNCYTNDDPAQSARHAAAHASMTLSDPTVQSSLTANAAFLPPPPPGTSYTADCETSPGQPFACVTAADGLCVNNYADYNSSPTPYTTNLCPSNECSFVYRRNYDDNGISDFLSPDTLKAFAPVENETGYTATPIAIHSNSAHATGTIVSCSFGTATHSAISIHGAPISTDISVNSNTHSSVTGTCSAAVIDVGPNTAFDYSNCIPPFNFTMPAWPVPPDGLHCNIDAETPHAPLGTVTFSFYSDPSLSVFPPQTAPAAGPHSSGAPVLTVPCTLGHAGGQPGYIAGLHPLGPWFHASWCSMTVTIPVDTTWYMDTLYAPGTTEHATTDLTNVNGPDSLETAITVD